MQLDEIVGFVCDKMNLIDANSIEICGTFVNRRYQMIYDSQDWIDSLISSVVSTANNQAVYSLPASAERIISMQNGASTVEPVDFTFLEQSYPNLLVEQGTPKFYIEFTTDSKVKSFQIFPTPDDAYTLLIYGKRPWVELGQADVPVLRNIDNCLIAFTYFDMLQRMRQFTKAQTVLDEATTALELMRQTEQVRGNRKRASSQITIAGDSLGEMSDSVAARIKDYTQETRLLVQEFLRRNYLELYDSALWPESVIIMQVPRDGSEVILPEYVDRVVSVRVNPQLGELVPADQALYFGINPQIFEQTGSPLGFSVLTSVGVAVLPPINEKLLFVSSDDSDNSAIFIRGETGGVEVEESIALNGKVPVGSVYAYDTPITVAKDLTAGTVAVTGYVSQQFLVQLLPNQRERKHIRIWLQPTPQDADGQVALLLGKRRIKPLMTDQDTPVLRGLGTVLINMATADMFDQAGNAPASATARAKAQLSLQTVQDRELNQTAYGPRVVPSVETYATDLDPFAYDHFCWTI